ncbi:MAG TPA: cell division protein ZapA [Thermoanaerobacterales bacterium]|jgi:cell division protein ZapA|nr:cell division protein ZapA [Thermoanaerobacterales bacterium]
MPSEAKSINRVKVRINGEDYYVKGTVPTEYIKQVADYVDRKMSDLSQNYPDLSRTRIAVLAALNITDELLRLKQEYEEFLTTFDEELKG